MVASKRKDETVPPLAARVAIVEARYYESIADELLKGAEQALRAADVRFVRFSVPGALEVPTAVAMALDAGDDSGQPFDGVVALGCVIRGETSHYDVVAMQSARALMDLSVTRRVPIGNGILTVENEEQARARASVQEGDKGGDAAGVAIALVRLKRELLNRLQKDAS